MVKWKNVETDRLFEAMLTLKTVEEYYLFFEDICTVKELEAMGQRLQVASELDAGQNYLEICAHTGASTATISRVNKCLQYGNGGYRIALDRLKEGKKQNDGR